MPGPGRPAMERAAQGPAPDDPGGDRHWIADEAVEAPGEDAQRRGECGQRQAGAARQREDPDGKRPARDLERRQHAGVAPGQRGRRRAVEGLSAEECSQRGRAVASHGAVGDVPHLPPGFVEPPHEIDVLAAPQVRIEELGTGRRIRPHDYGRAGDEGDGLPGRTGPGRVPWSSWERIDA